ncbi:MAG: threonylcarbamoyl-AMP synthase [Phycisphaerae bacterium]|nr:threonylcarbamoyl-AMP synthase [Phycisphaerae bacterium]
MTEQPTQNINRVEVATSGDEWVSRAAEILSRGGIVAFPTETVYGLAACPTVAGALDKLHAVKNRPSDKPYTVHLAHRRGMYEYVADPPWYAKVLARKGWPGPITLVVELTAAQDREARARFGHDYDKLFSDSAIGLRCPDHPAASKLLSAAGGPVVAPSANPSGEPPPTDADQVCRYFDSEQVDLVVDGGPTRFRGSSTVVRVDRSGFEVLREGVIGADAVAKMSRFNVLFVCTGNTCRSPMAEGLCQRILADELGVIPDELEGMGISVVSAGTMGMSGFPASPEAVEAMRGMGADISHHRSRPLVPELVNRADAVFAMTPDHVEFVSGLVPGARDRVELVEKDQGVSDPLGQPPAAYVACAQRLEDAIRDRLRELFR